MRWPGGVVCELATIVKRLHAALNDADGEGLVRMPGEREGAIGRVEEFKIVEVGDAPEVRDFIGWVITHRRPARVAATAADDMEWHPR